MTVGSVRAGHGDRMGVWTFIDAWFGAARMSCASVIFSVLLLFASFAELDALMFFPAGE